MFVGGACAAIACVLADPPPTAPAPPRPAPTIEHDSVSPPLTEKIGKAPSPPDTLTFAVPVKVDPDQALQFRVYLDFDQTKVVMLSTLQSLQGTEDGGIAIGDADIATRRITFQINTADPLIGAGCHSFTIFVAYGFDAFTQRPIPPGGDSVTWFYEPTADCSYVDGGPPTYVVDASGDGPTE